MGLSVDSVRRGVAALDLNIVGPAAEAVAGKSGQRYAKDWNLGDSVLYTLSASPLITGVPVVGQFAAAATLFTGAYQAAMGAEGTQPTGARMASGAQKVALGFWALCDPTGLGAIVAGAVGAFSAIKAWNTRGMKDGLG